MLKDFLYLQPTIKQVINLSTSKAFKKNKELYTLTNNEIEYLEKCLKVFFIFVKATTKLQAEKYLTIYYLMPKIYNIYNRLEVLKIELNVSSFIIILLLNTNSTIGRGFY